MGFISVRFEVGIIIVDYLMGNENFGEVFFFDVDVIVVFVIF